MTTLRWENAAEVVTIAGWACVKCHKRYGEGVSGEHAARYCCHADAPCDTDGCDGRKRKPYIFCRKCRDRKDFERWSALERVEWDGKTPLCTWNNDRFFFDEDDLMDWLVANDLEPEEVRVVLCEPDNGREFNMTEFLADSLPDDGECDDLDTTEIDGVVNRWIKANAPYSWRPTKKAISAASIRALFGVAAGESGSFDESLSE